MDYKDLTPAQKTAVNSNGRVLVSAAAGSGKTAVLVERVLKYLCDEANPVMADKILIVTFTNSAADELKSRIIDGLNSRLSENPDNELISKQTVLINQAQIATIDSFCIDFLRENFTVANMQYDFKIDDPDSVDYLRRNLLDQFFMRKHKEGDKEFKLLLQFFENEYDDNLLKNVVMKIYNKSCAMPIPKKWLDDMLGINIKARDDFNNCDYVKSIYCLLMKDVKDCAKAFSIVLSSVNNDTQYSIKNPGTAGRLRIYDALHTVDDYLAKLYEAAENGLWNECSNVLNNPSFKKFRSKDFLPDTTEAISYAYGLLSEIIKTYKNIFGIKLDLEEENFREFSECYLYLVNLVKEFIDCTMADSINRNSYSFDQIEHITLNTVLMPGSNALKEFNAQYDMIMVDEFQDTSNLQNALFDALSEHSNQIFTVGDVKQSIYGFRNANPANFLNKQKTYPEYSDGYGKILLNGNFRSRPEICDFINYIFERIMNEETTGIDYKCEHSLLSLGKFTDNEQSKVDLCLIDMPKGETKSEYEAEYVARYIKQTMEKPPFINDNNKLRKAEYKDIAVLMRSPGSRIASYVSVFKKYGIPVKSPSEDFYSSREIMDTMSLLRTVNDISDDVSLYSFMLSPIMGFDENEIAEIRCTDKKVTLYNNVKHFAESGNNHCKSVVDLIEYAKKISVTMSVSDLITVLFAKTSFIDIYGSMKNGELKKANLNLFTEIARTYSTNNNSDLSDFIRYIDNSGNSIKSASINSNENSVSIMSIHASKGLQFPVCILSSLTTRFNKIDSNSNLVISDTLGFAFDYKSLNYHSIMTPISKKYISSNISDSIYKEELRLLYVAMTRAVDKLALVCCQKELDTYYEKTYKLSDNILHNNESFDLATFLSANSYADWIISTLIASSYSEEKIEYNKIDAAELDEMEHISENPTDNSTPEISENLLFSYSNGGLNNVPAKCSVTDIVRKNRDNSLLLNTKPAFLLKDGLTPAEKGTATHKFMELCDYSNAAVSVENEITRLIEFEFITQKEGEAIDKESVSAFFNSSIYGLIKNAENVYKEYRFLVNIPAYEINSSIEKTYEDVTLVQGVADCVIEFKDYIVIVDFKTDVTDNEDELRNQYRKQLDIYAKALTDIFKKPVSKSLLYSFKLRKGIEL